MAPRRRDPKPGDWKYSVGEPPVQVTAYERPDRGMAIYVRTWDGTRYTRKQSLRGPIRDAFGKIIPDEEIAAQQALVAYHRAALAGVELAASGPLTLAEAFRRLLHAQEGKYAGGGRWAENVRRCGGVVVSVLGASVLAAELRHVHYRKLWRHLAEEHARRGTYGPRQAEIIVGTLRSCVVWLQQEGHIEAGTGLPAPNWKQALKDEWSKITGSPVAAPAKLRHSVAEQRKLWAALPKADPRLALALQIGAELRLGQVARTRRSDVLPHRGFRFGAVLIHGRGRKRGALVVLDMAQRHALTRAMTRGYLAEYEAAFRDGTIQDYYLIPGGRVRNVDGVLRPRIERSGQAWGQTGLRKAWERFEVAAGVTPVKGRKWYGLRRLSADLADRLEVSPGAKNRMGGWSKTSTREGYLHEGRIEDAEEAAAARTQIRPNAKRDNKMQPRKGRE